MADESPVNAPVTQAVDTRNWKPAGFILLCVSVVLPFLSFIFPFLTTLFTGYVTECLFLISWVAGILGARIYTESGWSVVWVIVAVIPVFGPLMVLAAISVDSLLAKLVVSNSVRRVAGLAIVVGGIGFLAAVVIPNFLNYNVKARQSEARSNLGGIWLAEKTFYEAHKRYGTFDEIGFKLAGPTRYTYRIDQTGTPGTVILGTGVAGRPVAPDNSVVPAGFTATGFTATATANIDNDPTIDQWHINDAKQGLNKADVDDVRN
jgi:type IV pilus assembly protein PilA